MNRVLGVDLGQSQDWTAFVVLDQIERQYVCRKLERPKLGTGYPKIVARVAEMMGSPLMKEAELVVDATGVGRPVVDAMEVAGLTPLGVVITGGMNETAQHGFYHVPKRVLISQAQVVLQQGRLTLPSSNELSAVLLTELRNFRVKITASAHETFEARQGKNDDLVLALCLALWRARHMELEPEGPPAPKAGTPAWFESERQRMKQRVVEQVEAEVMAGMEWDA